MGSIVYLASHEDYWLNQFKSCKLFVRTAGILDHRPVAVLTCRFRGLMPPNRWLCERLLVLVEWPGRCVWAFRIHECEASSDHSELMLISHPTPTTETPPTRNGQGTLKVRLTLVDMTDDPSVEVPLHRHDIPVVTRKRKKVVAPEPTLADVRRLRIESWSADSVRIILPNGRLLGFDAVRKLRFQARMNGFPLLFTVTALDTRLNRDTGQEDDLAISLVPAGLYVLPWDPCPPDRLTLISSDVVRDITIVS